MPVTLQAKARTAPAIPQAQQSATEPTKGLAERDTLHPGSGRSRPRMTTGSHRLPRLETRLSYGPEPRVLERRPTRFVALDDHLAVTPAFVQPPGSCSGLARCQCPRGSPIARH
jgi:hypothetical protein